MVNPRRIHGGFLARGSAEGPSGPWIYSGFCIVECSWKFQFGRDVSSGMATFDSIPYCRLLVDMAE
eukprot:2655156-Alexandrium_andersonii.AAC.1